jgi:hypothetical protein
VPEQLAAHLVDDLAAYQALHAELTALAERLEASIRTPA